MRRRSTKKEEREKVGYTGVPQDARQRQQQPTSYYKSSELGDGQPTVELDSRPSGGEGGARHEMQG